MEWPFGKKIQGEKRSGDPVIMQNPATGEVIRAENSGEVEGALHDNNQQWKEAA